MAQLRWTLTSEVDLQGIEEYIARDSVMRAVSFVDRLVQAAERLRGNPAMGRVIPEFAHPDLRELILGNYRIVYHLKNDVVTVLRVVHGTRDLKELVRREPWEV